MFDSTTTQNPAVSAVDLRAWVEVLGVSAAPDNEVACVDLLRVLEELTCAAAGLQTDTAPTATRRAR